MRDTQIDRKSSYKTEFAKKLRLLSAVILATTIILGISAPGLTISLYGDQPVHNLKVEVLSVIPHDTNAFTQGLLIQNGRMFESTGLYGRSELREIASASGEVLRSVPLPDNLFGEGLAAVDTRLIQITWREHVAIVYNRETFSETTRFSYTGEGWGLCYDGSRLIMSDGSDTLYFRSPDDFSILTQVKVTLNDQPLTRLNELEYVNGFVYANVWQQNVIVKIAPSTGRVVAVIDASGLLTPAEYSAADVLNGIAYDPEQKNFLITGKLWPKMFVVRFVPTQVTK